ncbi:MAG TPA: PIN domain-containing protein [Candidatus Saccharimonadales bacterium]|nr:PIN domain-containing protein [Candidatus Saccharimonadales bacterium]
MNKAIILDSSALVSLIVKIDTNHQKATQISKEIIKKQNELILPYEIFAETINVIGKKSGKKEALEAISYCIEYHKKEIITFSATNPDQLIRATKKFSGLKNSVSFTDCLVMAFADEFDTKIIFGFDKVFGQSGYILPGGK